MWSWWYKHNTETHNRTIHKLCGCMILHTRPPWFIRCYLMHTIIMLPCASYQMRKIAGCACAGNSWSVFSRHRLQRKPLVNDPGMHRGTCATHVEWCMSRSLNRGGGENVPGIPGACATCNFTYLIRGPWRTAFHIVGPSQGRNPSFTDGVPHKGTMMGNFEIVIAVSLQQTDKQIFKLLDAHVIPISQSYIENRQSRMN